MRALDDRDSYKIYFLSEDLPLTFGERLRLFSIYSKLVRCPARINVQVEMLPRRARAFCSVQWLK